MSTVTATAAAAPVRVRPRRRRLGVVGGVGLALLILLVGSAIFAPWIAPYNPEESSGNPFAAPSRLHPLGTNDIGQDILSELIYGTRISLAIGSLAAIVAISIGTLIGPVAGYFGAGGAPASPILRLHVLPVLLSLSLAQFILAASNAILIEASLAFLGLGDPTAKSWGSILYYAQVRSAFLSGAWLWWVLPPGLLITLAVLGFAFTGFALEEVLNPRLRGMS